MTDDSEIEESATNGKPLDVIEARADPAERPFEYPIKGEQGRLGRSTRLAH